MPRCFPGFEVSFFFVGPFRRIRDRSVFMKWLFLLLAGSVLIPCLDPCRAAGESAPPGPLSLTGVISSVLTNHAGLRASRARWEAAKENASQARAWDDPRAGVDLERSGSTRLDSIADAEWSLSQTLPVSGKNRWRGRAADAEAQVAFQEARRAELDAIAAAKTAYFEYANAEAQQRLNEKLQRLLRQAVETVQARYQAGGQSEADWLMAKSELARVEESMIDIRRQTSDAVSALNRLMNRPPWAPLQPPGPIPHLSHGFGVEYLIDVALSRRPEILIAEQRRKAAEARVTVAKRSWIPDPEIRVEARQFNGGSKTIDEYDTGVFFSMPWFNRGKYKAAIREQEAVRESADQTAADSRAEISRRVYDQFRKIETLHHHSTLFDDHVLPLARETFNARRLSYETGKSDFSELLAAERMLQEAETMYSRHLADYAIGLADLEALVGVDLETLLRNFDRDWKPLPAKN
jgi:cobalt-zinc-cadmium efflux system outer membrane protein